MKRFLLSCVFFLMGVLLLLGAAEYLARICPNAYSMKEDWMRGHVDEVETLVLGSSHTYAAIKPEVLSSRAFNLSNSSQTQRYDWLLLARDSTSFTSLKTIVYPASSLLMDYRLEETSERYRCTYYQLYNHIGNHSLFSKYAWEVANIQTCCWKVQSLFISGESDRMCDDYGWCTFYQARPSQKDNLTRENVVDRIGKYREREEIRSDEECYFDEIASFCQRHGVRLLLLGTPVSKVFLNDPDAKNYQTMIEEKALQEASRYDCIEYRDYSDDARFDEDDFFDVDHLNSTGATKFSEIVRQDFAL